MPLRSQTCCQTIRVHPLTLLAANFIKQEQFVACFDNVHPAKQGERPENERIQSNKAVLLGCLQKANTTITNEKLDKIMDRYRPGGHEAQVPQ